MSNLLKKHLGGGLRSTKKPKKHRDEIVSLGLLVVLVVLVVFGEERY